MRGPQGEVAVVLDVEGGSAEAWRKVKKRVVMRRKKEVERLLQLLKKVILGFWHFGEEGDQIFHERFRLTAMGSLDLTSRRVNKRRETLVLVKNFKSLKFLDDLLL